MAACLPAAPPAERDHARVLMCRPVDRAAAGLPHRLTFHNSPPKAVAGRRLSSTARGELQSRPAPASVVGRQTRGVPADAQTLASRPARRRNAIPTGRRAGFIK
jgi:hypothetical protein